MNSFRVRRYLAALLWAWVIPFTLGFIASSVTFGWQLVEVLSQYSQLFTDSFNQVVASCAR
ncbi:hypothetical protein D9M68_966040 [compost metagenome]